MLTRFIAYIAIVCRTLVPVNLILLLKLRDVSVSISTGMLIKSIEIINFDKWHRKRAVLAIKIGPLNTSPYIS